MQETSKGDRTWIANLLAGEAKGPAIMWHATQENDSCNAYKVSPTNLLTW